MPQLNGLLESLRLYGFAIIGDDQKSVLNSLRSTGIIHLFNVHRLGKYTILEVNVHGCERECSISCRDGNGAPSFDCYGECLDICVTDKLNSIVNAITAKLSESQS
uniref:Uncharacterized protein n=1 Tax=Ignisphaera aggregans TaxID=334771 RepID=A0A7C2Z9V4_9CREN